MLLTNKRAILVPRKVVSFGGKVLLFGVAGAYYAEATARTRQLDLETVDPVVLASEPHSIVVSHSSIVSLSMGPGLVYPSLRVRFTDEQGKSRHLDLVVRPPPEF